MRAGVIAGWLLIYPFVAPAAADDFSAPEAASIACPVFPSPTHTQTIVPLVQTTETPTLDLKNPEPLQWQVVSSVTGQVFDTGTTSGDLIVLSKDRTRYAIEIQTGTHKRFVVKDGTGAIVTDLEVTQGSRLIELSQQRIYVQIFSPRGRGTFIGIDYTSNIILFRLPMGFDDLVTVNEEQGTVTITKMSWSRSPNRSTTYRISDGAPVPRSRSRR